MHRPLRRRLALLAFVAVVGSVTFLPFLAATSTQSVGALATFAVVVSVVSTVAAWLGLRFADATGLPMPILRALETGEPRGPIPKALAATIATGIALGLVGLGVLRLVQAPSLPGSATARALSTLFAAGPLEIVLHLFVMSGVVRLARGRRWPGVVAAAAALVLFHLADAPSQPAAIIAASIVGNGAAGLAFGVLYASFGFEFAMLGHAVAHLLTVLAG